MEFLVKKDEKHHSTRCKPSGRACIRFHGEEGEVPRGHVHPRGFLGHDLPALGGEKPAALDGLF
jgi:hypothetical protein